MKFSAKSLFLGLLVAVFANGGEVSIAAAANTTYAFDEIKAEFAKAHPEITLNVSLGASGALTHRLKTELRLTFLWQQIWTLRTIFSKMDLP